MGFPCDCFFPTMPNPFMVLLHLLHLFRLSVSILLFYLGLYPYSNQRLLNQTGDHVHYSLVAGFPSPPTVDVDPSLVKSRLPVVGYRSSAPCQGEGAVVTCVVCLGALEEEEEVRELGNCSHVFHKGCIDSWVDEGQDTCPLCRAQLIPVVGGRYVEGFLI